MKIYFVYPKFPVTIWGFEYVCRIFGKRSVEAPLSLLTVAGLTPPMFDIVLCDENAESIQWDTDAEVVALSGMHLQRPRLIEVARRFRALGKLVVIGGVSVTSMPGWYRPFADVLICGEAEYVWPKFLSDLVAGRPKPEYYETGQVALSDSLAPRFNLVSPRHYSYAGIQTSRGCPYVCEFCDIPALFGHRVRRKSADQVVGEVDRLLSLGFWNIPFVDDNFSVDREHAYVVLEALKRFMRKSRGRLSHSCQASIDVVKDRTLLKLMYEAGMRSMFIGIETPRVASLEETRKYQNVRHDLLRGIETVQSHGIAVSMGTMVGFDHDDQSIFDEQVEFIAKTRVSMIFPNQVYALPKTALHERMRREGRLRDTDMWDELTYNNQGFIESNIVLHKLTREQLNAGFISMLLRVYEPTVFAERLLGEVERLQRTPADLRSVPVKGSLLWLELLWISLWFVVDSRRGPLLRVLRRVLPSMLTRNRYYGYYIMTRLLMYGHIYRLIHRWERTQQQHVPQATQDAKAAGNGARSHHEHRGHRVRSTQKRKNVTADVQETRTR